MDSLSVKEGKGCGQSLTLTLAYEAERQRRKDEEQSSCGLQEMIGGWGEWTHQRESCGKTKTKLLS